MSKDDILAAIKNAVVMGHLDKSDEGFDGDMEGEPGTLELVQEALDNGAEAGQILTAFNSAMDIVGKKYEAGQYLLPDMLAGAECVGEAMDIVEPHLVGEAQQRKGKFLIATVKGDLHDIGKNIVATMLKGAGYEVKDLGIDVATEDIVKAVQEFQPDYVGLSALLTTTMIEMEHVIQGIKEAGFDNIKVFIGGAPTSPEFARKIGANEHCHDAFEVVEKLNAYQKAS